MSDTQLLSEDPVPAASAKNQSLAGRQTAQGDEEETNPSRFSIHRLAHYCLDLSELYGTERVVPVVIFLREARNLPEHLQLGGDQLTYLSFSYLKCELAKLDASQYLQAVPPRIHEAFFVALIRYSSIVCSDIKLAYSGRSFTTGASQEQSGLYLAITYHCQACHAQNHSHLRHL